MKKIILISIIGLFLLSYAFASSTGGAFSPIILNARSAGIGETYVAISDDLGGLVYNPAGLTNIDIVTIGFSHLQIPQGYTRVEFIGAGLNINGTIVGAGLESKGITNEEELLFPFQENAISLNIARKILPNLSLGFRGHFYSATLDTAKATGFGFDFGAIYEVNNMLKVGACWYNPISYLKWSTGTIESVGKEDLVLGTALILDLKSVLLTLALDVSLYEKMYFYQRLHIGSEIKIPGIPVLFRTGYNGEKNTFSIGIGLNLNNIQFDYAFLYSKDLSNQHIFGLSLKY
uniref:PorV/PorQ family protein n=1 Tax=Dictyoglomus thermophilum TaxID=14 RepID=A0A7C3MII7_DICTH